MFNKRQMNGNNNLKRKKIKAFAFLTMVVILFTLFPFLKFYFTTENIKFFIESQNSTAPLIYLAMLIFLPLIGVPRIILASTGGALFGFWFGTIYAVSGSSLAAVLAYCLAFFSASEYFEESVNKEGKFFSALNFSRENNFNIIVLARICPVINCEVVNYICGALKVPFFSFILATVIGTIPGTVIYVLLGDSLMRISLKNGFWQTLHDIVTRGSMAAVLQDKDLYLFLIAVLMLGLFFIFTVSGFYMLVKRKQLKHT